MSANWRSSLAGPIPSHPMYADDSAWLQSRRPVPRVRNEGVINAELQRGCMDILFKMQALTAGSGELDKPRFRKAPVKGKESLTSSSTSSMSSDGETTNAVTFARPPSRRAPQRPQTPGHALATSRTSQVSVRPSGPPPPPQNDSQSIAALDSDIRLIRSELDSLRQRLHTRFDSGQRPQPRRREEEFEDERSPSHRPPNDWIERTRRRREVEEEVTYRRANGSSENYHWRSASPDGRTVRFESPVPVRGREQKLEALRARERELAAMRYQEEEELAALKAKKRELLREERNKKKVHVKEQKEEKDPDCPEGYRRVPDEERRAMLDLMMQAEADVRQRLSKLPVILDTYRSRQRKKDLEEALDELEGAIAVYAQRKVYIRRDI